MLKKVIKCSFLGQHNALFQIPISDIGVQAWIKVTHFRNKMLIFVLSVVWDGLQSLLYVMIFVFASFKLSRLYLLLVLLCVLEFIFGALSRDGQRGYSITLVNLSLSKRRSSCNFIATVGSIYNIFLYLL